MSSQNVHLRHRQVQAIPQHRRGPLPARQSAQRPRQGHPGSNRLWARVVEGSIRWIGHQDFAPAGPVAAAGRIDHQPVRPALGSAAASVESVRLDPELKRALLARAAAERVSVSEVIRRAIGEYLRAS